MKNTPDDELPCLYDYLIGRLDLIPRECTPAELKRLIELHDLLLAEKPLAGMGGIVDPQLIHPAVSPGEAGAAIAWIISPCDFGFYIPDLNACPKRLIASLYCPGHDPGTPLADSINLGRTVSARAFFDLEPDDSIWGQEPL